MSNNITELENVKYDEEIIQSLIVDLKREKGIKITVEKREVAGTEVYALTKYYNNETRNTQNIFYPNVKAALAAVEAIHDYLVL